jgi:hypothetical protein
MGREAIGGFTLPFQQASTPCTTMVVARFNNVLEALSLIFKNDVQNSDSNVI